MYTFMSGGPICIYVCMYVCMYVCIIHACMFNKNQTDYLTRDFVDELQHSDDGVIRFDGHAQYRLRAVT